MQSFLLKGNIWNLAFHDFCPITRLASGVFRRPLTRIWVKPAPASHLVTSADPYTCPPKQEKNVRSNNLTRDFIVGVWRKWRGIADGYQETYDSHIISLWKWVPMMGNKFIPPLKDVGFLCFPYPSFRQFNRQWKCPEDWTVYQRRLAIFWLHRLNLSFAARGTRNTNHN